MVKDTDSRLCFECGQPFISFRGSAFCCRAHQKVHNNRMVREGVSLVPLLKAWAAGRGGGNSAADPRAREAMRELTRYARDLNDADRTAGRPDALTYYSHLTRDQTQYTDRQRRRR